MDDTFSPVMTRFSTEVGTEVIVLCVQEFSTGIQYSITLQVFSTGEVQ
jgi:hypothetical protein